MVVYSCINIINKKEYIGITSGCFQHRISCHKCNAFTRNNPNHLYRAMRKYGWENFVWTILDKTAKSFEELLEKERYYIDLRGTFKNGYNMTDGGDGVLGLSHTEETKSKISVTLKGVKKGPLKKDHYDKVALINKEKIGKTYEEIYGEEKAALIKEKQSQKSFKFHEENKEHHNWLKETYDEKYGKEKSLKIKEKMSSSLKSKLIEGKRTDISEKGREGMRDAKIGENNPNFIKLSPEDQKIIIDLYKKFGRITTEVVDESKYSKYIIKKFLKEIDLYEGRRKYQNDIGS